MNAKSILVLVLSGAWFWFCQNWHCCWVRGVCCANSITEKAVAPAATTPETTKNLAAENGPLVFNWSNEKATTTDKFPAFKDAQLANMTADNFLEITGYYYPEEENTSQFANMGLARANDIKQRFTDKIPPERIRIKAQLRSKADDKVKSNAFESAKFSWIAAEKKEEVVEELEDRMLVRFPYNSTQKVRNPEIDNYLSNLATQLQKSGEKVLLTGHTDNKGDEAYNNKLGLQRANVIRDILIRKGVDKSLIMVESKGEKQAIATNDTEEGRQANRRTEIKILK